MDIHDLLQDEKATILEDAWRSVLMLTHYRRDGEAATRERLEALYDHVAAAIRMRDLSDLLDYAEAIARQRFDAGFDLCEVQTAFFMLEEAIWARALARLPTAELPEGLGLVGTAIGRGKDALGRIYISLASHGKVPSLDLTRFFKGT